MQSTNISSERLHQQLKPLLALVVKRRKWTSYSLRTEKRTISCMLGVP